MTTLLCPKGGEIIKIRFGFSFIIWLIYFLLLGVSSVFLLVFVFLFFFTAALTVCPGI